jgi:enoyl-[acyl-carrier protein] reductase I
MTLLQGKTALIFGVANNRSIAWGIAEALHNAGATVAFTYAGEVLKRRVTPLAASLGSDFIEECDVTDDAAIDRVFQKVGEKFGKIDIVVHSVAFANRDELNGPCYDTSRAGFHLAMDISCYSLIAITRTALPYLNPNSCILTMSYYGGVKVIPAYNVMGLAKAALENAVRYLAVDLGPIGHRVNCISAGPIKSLAAAGINSFKDLYAHFARFAPLRRNITIEDVGNAAIYLCSDLAKGVTGEIHYVDGGYNVIGVPADKEMLGDA